MSRQRLHLTSLKTCLVECGGYQINAPVFLVNAFKIIEQNIKSVGIFRIGGQVKRVQLVKKSFSGDVAIPDEVTVNDVCDAVKAFFRELEEPLLSAALQAQFIRSIMTLSRNDVKARSILQLCRVLSQRHRETLAFLMWNLKKISEASDVNRMNISNIALVMSLSVFRTDEDSSHSQVQEAKRDSELKAAVVEILIKHADSLCRLAKRSEPLPPARNKYALPQRTTRTSITRSPRTKTFVGINDLRPPSATKPEPPRRRSSDWSERVSSSTKNATAAESKTTSLNPKLPQPGGGISATNSTRRPWQRKLDTFVMNTSDLDKTVTPIKLTRSVSDAAERQDSNGEDNGERRRSVGVPAKIRRGQPNTIRTGLDKTKRKSQGEAGATATTDKGDSALANAVDQSCKADENAKPLEQNVSAENINLEEAEEAKDEFAEDEFHRKELLASKAGPPPSFNRIFRTPSTPSRDRASIAFIRDKNRGQVQARAAAFENVIRQTSGSTMTRPKAAPKPSVPTFTQVTAGNKRRSPTKKYATRLAVREASQMADL